MAKKKQVTLEVIQLKAGRKPPAVGDVLERGINSPVRVRAAKVRRPSDFDRLVRDIEDGDMMLELEVEAT